MTSPTHIFRKSTSSQGFFNRMATLHKHLTSDNARIFHANVMRLSSDKRLYLEALRDYARRKMNMRKLCKPDHGGMLYDEYGTGLQTLAAEDVLKAWGVDPESLFYETEEAGLGRGWNPTDMIHAFFEILKAK